MTASRNVRPSNYVSGFDDPEPRDPRVQKFIDMLTSRKVWVLLFGLATSTGMISLTENESLEIINAILVLIGAGLIGFNIAVEDGLRAWAESRRK